MPGNLLSTFTNYSTNIQQLSAMPFVTKSEEPAYPLPQTLQKAAAGHQQKNKSILLKYHMAL